MVKDVRNELVDFIHDKSSSEDDVLEWMRKAPDVETYFGGGWTPTALVAAYEARYLRVFKGLIQRGADAYVVAFNETFPLETACLDLEVDFVKAVISTGGTREFGRYPDLQRHFLKSCLVLAREALTKGHARAKLSHAKKLLADEKKNEIEHVIEHFDHRLILDD